MDAERNFLFGLAAVRAGRLDATRLVQAELDWLSSRDRSLAEFLTERGLLTEADVSTIEERLRREWEDPTADATTTPPRDHDRSTVEFSPSKSDGSGLRSTIEIDGSGADRSGRRPADGGAPGFGWRYTNVVAPREGGIGRVWQATDTVLGRQVALKELRPDRNEPATRRRFVEEAKITSRLLHPNIVPVHDLVEAGEQPFYSMKYLTGHTLREAIGVHHRGASKGSADPAPTLRDLLGAFLGVCNAIGFAHKQGVIHRDIKGQNVILGEFGEVVVLDWGLAKRIASDDDPLAVPVPGARIGPECSMGGTMPGQAIGTPNYMSPEQAAGDHDRISEKSDIFGLGALLYLILTDHPPFEGRETVVVIHNAIKCEFPAPRTLNGSVPPALESICLKAMAKKPEERYESVAALAEDVRRWVDDEPVPVHPDGLLTRAARWSRKHQPAVAGAAALLITAFLGLAIGSWVVSAQATETLKAEKARFKEREMAFSTFNSALQPMTQVLGVLVTDLPQVRDPRVDQIREKVAAQLGDFLAIIARRYPEDIRVRALYAQYFRERGILHADAYRFREAEDAHRQGIAVLAPDGDGAKLTFRLRDLAAEIQIELARSMYLRDDLKAAETSASEALRLAEISRRALPDNTDYWRTEARARLMLGEIALKRGKAAEAADLCRAAAALFDRLPGDASANPRDGLLRLQARISQGVAQREADRLRESTTVLTEAGKHAQALLQANAEDVENRHLAARQRIELARSQDRAKDRSAALATLDESILDSLAALSRDRPTSPVFKETLAYACIARGEIRGDDDKDFARARDVLDDLLKLAPGSLRPRCLRARAIIQSARVALARGDTTAATRLIAEAAPDLTALRDLIPVDGDAREVDELSRGLLRRIPAP